MKIKEDREEQKTLINAHTLHSTKTDVVSNIDKQGISSAKESSPKKGKYTPPKVNEGVASNSNSARDSCLADQKKLPAASAVLITDQWSMVMTLAAGDPRNKQFRKIGCYF